MFTSTAVMEVVDLTVDSSLSEDESDDIICTETPVKREKIDVAVNNMKILLWLVIV